MARDNEDGGSKLPLLIALLIAGAAVWWWWTSRSKPAPLVAAPSAARAPAAPSPSPWIVQLKAAAGNAVVNEARPADAFAAEGGATTVLDPETGRYVVAIAAAGQRVRSNSGPTLAGDFVVQVEFKNLSQTNEHGGVFSIPGDLMVHIQGGSRELFVRAGNQYHTLGVQCVTGVWYRLTVQRTAGTLWGYVNGNATALAGQAYPDALNRAGEGLVLGEGTEGATVFGFSGQIRSVIVGAGGAPAGFAM